MSRPARRPRANHSEAAESARQQPGTWVTVNDYRSGLTARDVVRRIRTGTPIGSPANSTPYLPAGAFEARIELLDEDTRVEARFVGAPAPTTSTISRKGHSK